MFLQLSVMKQSVASWLRSLLLAPSRTICGKSLSYEPFCLSFTAWSIKLRTSFSNAHVSLLLLVGRYLLHTYGEMSQLSPIYNFAIDICSCSTVVFSNGYVQVVVLNGSKVTHMGNIWQYDHHFFGTKFVQYQDRPLSFIRNFIEECSYLMPGTPMDKVFLDMASWRALSFKKISPPLE